jgi:hypothetical protein
MPIPIKLEILSLVPITYRQCSHCEQFYDQSGIGQQVHNQILAEYPQDLLEDHYRISSLVVELLNRFKDEIIVHIIDPQSLQGIFKSLRFRVRKYPTFIVDGQEMVIGWDRPALERAIKSRLSAQ